MRKENDHGEVNGSGNASPKLFVPELLILLNEPIDKFILDSLYTNYEIKIKIFYYN